MSKITTKPGKNERELRILVDDVPLTEHAILSELSLKSQKSFNLIGKCCIREILKYITGLYIDEIDISDWLQVNTISSLFEIHGFYLISSSDDQDSAFTIACSLAFNLADWKSAWSANEFIEEFLKIYLGIDTSDLFSPVDREYLEDFGDDQKYIYAEALLQEKSYRSNLKEILNSFSELLAKVNELTIKNLHNKADSHRIVEYFCFPEEVKTACSQYLQYFYEFLRDLGVKALINLTVQDSGGVLFTVAPANKSEALEKIRLALDIYLKLPSSRINVNSSEIEAQALYAQILNFKSQLVMAAATIQQQQSTIQNLQQKPLAENVLLLSQRSDGKDQEPLLGEMIKIGELELLDGAITVNLAEVFRKLRQLLRKT